MNAARKLIAFVATASARVRDQIHHPECTPADIIAARATIAHMRADLDECDQALRAAYEQTIRRKDPLTPALPAITDRDVDRYAARLHASCGGDAEDLVVESFANVERPDRPLPNRRPHLAPGRYTFDYHARRLLAESGTFHATRKPA